MTNKVKPFYIRITDDMTAQTVQDALDKCADAGINAREGLANTIQRHVYTSDIDFEWVYFGVDDENDTYFNDVTIYFGEDAKEITIDQLDEWLGLEGEQDWKNGDRCMYKGSGAVVIGWHPNQNVVVIDSDNFGLDSCSPCELSKPEKPEQKAERERLEDGKSLFELAQKLWTEVQSDYEVCSYNSPMVCDNTKELYARLAEKVGYSKQKTDRNQLEVAYDLYIAGQESLAVKKQQSFQQFTSDKVQVKFWLAVADKAGYCKQ